jgi:two-component system response regulator
MDAYNSVDILLAEDNDADAELTIHALRSIGIRNRVFHVQDGVEALAFLFREGRFATRDSALPKLVLLDISMPRLDGMAVLRQLREHASTKDLPIAMLTASTKESEFFESQHFRVWDYLVKPVKPEALMELIKQSGLSLAG